MPWHNPDDLRLLGDESIERSAAGGSDWVPGLRDHGLLKAVVDRSAPQPAKIPRSTTPRYQRGHDLQRVDDRDVLQRTHQSKYFGLRVECGRRGDKHRV
jgi:hypothetical protein